MISSLPMYDRPEVAAANDRFWHLVRGFLGAGPPELDRTTDNWSVWTDPNLILSQTCGKPFRNQLHGKVQLVGTPDYGLPGAHPGFYYSVIVVRQGDSDHLPDYDLRRFAYNHANSQSGWSAMQNHISGTGLHFGHEIRTGSHTASARAIAEDRADIAAIDAQSWRMIERYDAFAAALKVIGHTEPTPGLPFITAAAVDAPQVSAAVRDAIETLAPGDRDLLNLQGLVDISEREYMRVPDGPPPRQA